VARALLSYASPDLAEPSGRGNTLEVCTSLSCQCLLVRGSHKRMMLASMEMANWLVLLTSGLL